MLQARHTTPHDLNGLHEVPREPIAIVGIGCRLPGGADSPEAFWQLLRDGVDAIREVPEDRWLLRAFHDPDRDKAGKMYSRWGGFVENIDRFDAAFFGISPREAEVMDPQHRLLLEVAWEALEDGGLTVERLAGSSTGVFVGISSHDFAALASAPSERKIKNAYKALGTTPCVAANRISHALDLRGPSLAVDTACSSSLVALHLACQSLWQGESSLALVGGANLLLKPEAYIGFCNASMLSPDGRCKSFDARANGYVRAEGAGMIVLEPLAQALQEGHRVYAVIQGTAVNQDGHTNGITVPSGEAQEALLREACRQAGVPPQAVQVVEAHGTGTPVGDPIEANALGAVLGAGRPAERPCVIGSAKSNIGHLEAGAGIAGVIKVALALSHREIPASLHFETPNPQIDLERLGLRVPQRTEPWLDNGPWPRLAGVNSFGFGGMNAHAVLAEAAPVEELSRADDRPGAHLVPLSARSREALQELAESYRSWLDSSPDVSPGELAWNAALRRSHLPHRLALVADSRAQLLEGLDALGRGESPPGRAVARLPVVFVFTGMGPQWWAMGRQLLAEEPVFRALIEECDDHFRRHAGWSLLHELGAEETASRMQEAWIAQPAIFALQVGLAALWRSWGIEPDAIVGHSVGEVAAACVAGALSLADAATVILHRGRLANQARGAGVMLAVGLSLEQAQDLLHGRDDRISVAAVNSPQAVTLSGDACVLEEVSRQLEARGTFCRFLAVDIPYHSPQLEPYREELLASLDGILPQPAEKLLVSTVTGRPVSGPELEAAYWWRNMREPVAFAGALARLLEVGHSLFLEVGPHPVLAASIKECAAEGDRAVVTLSSLRRREPERATMLAALGKLYTLGHPVSWARLHPVAGRTLQLPLYPWQREHHWRESEESRRLRLGLSAGAGQGLLGNQVHPLLGQPVLSAHADPAWDVELDLQQDHGWLADHCLRGGVIYPGSAYVEMALAAVRDRLGEGPCEVAEVEFHKPLFLTSGEPRRLQLLAERSGGDFEVHGKEEGSWTRHATGRFRLLGSETPPEQMRLDEIRARCPDDVPVERWYQEFHEVGLDYGPLFRGVEQLYRGRGEALGRVRAPEALLAALGEYRLHPALLDACFQVIRAAVPEEAAVRLYLPRKIGRVRLIKTAGAELWSHARLVCKTESFIEEDIRIFDAVGGLVAEIQGFRCQAAADARASRGTNDYLYGYRWQEQARTGEVRGPETSGCWLILADAGGLGRRLADRLTERGEQPILVRPGNDYRRRADGCFLARPGHSEDMQRLLEGMAAAGRPCRGVIHLWALDGPVGEETTVEALESAEEVGCLSALHVVQACAGMAWREPPRLWLVTRGAWAVGAAAPLAVVGAPLWGLGRVISNEHPELRCTRIDLDPQPPLAEDVSLAEELWLDAGEDEIALRGLARYVHRLQALSLEEIPRVASGGAVPAGFRLEVGTPGVLDSLTLQSAGRREPGPGEIEIDVRAVGLNFKDVAKAMNLLGDDTLEGTRSGRELGLECAGTVVAIGDGVEGFRVGDAVLAMAPGSFRTHLTTSASFAALKPAHLGFEEAVTIPVVFVTACYALRELAQIQPGERVLIHAAAGGVGLAAVQIAQAVGAEIFATAGSAEKRDFLSGLGVAHVMDSRSLDFADQVLQATGGEGVDVVLNSLTGEAIARSLSVLRPCGRFVEIGKRDIEQNSKLGLRPFQKHLSYFAVDLDRLWAVRPEAMSRAFHRVMAEVGRRAYRPLPHRAFPISQVAEAFQHMARARHIGKVVVTMQDPSAVVAPSAEATFRADGTYLITGGLGGFGLATARWMVERGARNLVLIGRSGASSPQAREAVRLLQETGARVVVARADVARAGQLNKVLAEVRRTLPPLRGVVHAAMVLDDAVLLRLDAAKFRAVTAPKVAGAWNLHQLTRNDPLDCFVLFSSAAATVGNRGQGNYVAANLFLDALAHHRHALGLPALAVNWTAVADVGYVAEHASVRSHLAQLGLAAVPTGQLLKVLGELLPREAVQVAVMLLDGRRWAEHDPVAALPRFSAVVSRGEAETDGAGKESLGAVGCADPAAIRARVESCLLEQVSKVLGTPVARLDRDQPLTAMGLDSLMTLELGTRLKKELGAELATAKLMRGATLDDLVNDLAGQVIPSGARGDGGARMEPASPRGEAPRPNAPGIDWKAETTLVPAIVPCGETPSSEEGDILMTGATGFLGAFLLRELLWRTDRRVVCIVRCRRPEEGMDRLRAALESYLLWNEELAARIKVLPGDLSQPGLGMSPEDFRELTGSVGVIYHNGARLSLMESYGRLRPDNVLGTCEVLRLACQGRAKPVHFVSSLGVFDLPPTAEMVTIRETDLPQDLDRLKYGYTQSKAVAELLVRAAGSRGLPVTIYRPGLINACAETGAYTTQDFPARLIKSWTKLGVAPRMDRDLLFTPVDYVSRAIIALSQQPTCRGETYHLVNPHVISSHALCRLIQSAGYPIEEMPFAEWRSRLAAQAGHDRDEDLTAVLPLAADADALPLWPPRNMRFDCRATLAGLATEGITCPRVDGSVVAACLTFFSRTGFLEPAPRAPKPKSGWLPRLFRAREKT